MRALNAACDCGKVGVVFARVHLHRIGIWTLRVCDIAVRIFLDAEIAVRADELNRRGVLRIRLVEVASRVEVFVLQVAVRVVHRNRRGAAYTLEDHGARRVTFRIDKSNPGFIFGNIRIFRYLCRRGKRIVVINFGRAHGDAALEADSVARNVIDCDTVGGFAAVVDEGVFVVFSTGERDIARAADCDGFGLAFRAD